MSDILVIGGGVIGASITYHLAARGADVTLVERGTICSGETAKSGGFVQTHWDTLAEVRLIRHSRDVFADWANRIGGDCGFVQGGYLHVTGPEREPAVRRVHQMLLDDGIESHWIDRDALAELQPILNLDRLTGGAWEPTSGWCDPVATTRSFVEAARRHGATIREGVTVTSIAHAGDRVTGVETTAGTLPCRVAILAAGPYAPRLALAPLPITIERGQCGYMSRPGNMPVNEIGFYDEVTGLYTHPAGDTNLIGCDRNMPFPLVHDPDDYKRDVDGKWVARAGMALGYRLPALRESLIQRGVTGLYDFTPDGQPILDGPLAGIAGYYVAAGFSGVGFKSAPATGLGMAELVLDGKATSVDIDHLRLSRLTPA